MYRKVRKSFASLIQPGLRPMRSEFCTFDAELSTVNSQQGLGSWSVHASPLECTVSKNVPVNPLESALTRLLGLKSFRFRTYEKRGGGGWVLGVQTGRMADRVDREQ